MNALYECRNRRSGTFLLSDDHVDSPIDKIDKFGVLIVSITLRNSRSLDRINFDPPYVFGVCGIISCSDETVTKNFRVAPHTTPCRE
jgi:hypothetical protein